MKKIIFNFFCCLLTSLACFGEGTNATQNTTRKRKCQVVAVKCLDQSKVLGKMTISGSSSKQCINEYSAKCNPTEDKSASQFFNQFQLQTKESSCVNMEMSNFQICIDNEAYVGQKSTKKVLDSSISYASRHQDIETRIRDTSLTIGNVLIANHQMGNIIICNNNSKGNMTLDFSVVNENTNQSVLESSCSESKAESEVQATYSNQSIERNPRHEMEVLDSETANDMTYGCPILDNSISQTTSIGERQTLSSSVVNNRSKENKIQDASSVNENCFGESSVLDSTQVNRMGNDVQTKDKSLIFGSNNFLSQTLDSTIANSIITNTMKTIDKSCNGVMIANITSTSYDKAFCSSVNSEHPLEWIGFTYGMMQTYQGTGFNGWLVKSPIGFNSSMSFDGFVQQDGTFAEDAKYLNHNISRMYNATKITPTYTYSELGFGSSFREAMRILNDKSTSEEQRSRINDRMFKVMLLQQRIQESRTKLK